MRGIQGIPHWWVRLVTILLRFLWNGDKQTMEINLFLICPLFHLCVCVRSCRQDWGWDPCTQWMAQNVLGPESQEKTSNFELETKSNTTNSLNANVIDADTNIDTDTRTRTCSHESIDRHDRWDNWWVNDRHQFSADYEPITKKSLIESSDFKWNDCNDHQMMRTTHCCNRYTYKCINQIKSNRIK